MNNLDEKLECIFENCFGTTVSGDSVAHVAEALGEVRQAFIDNGWIKSSNSKIFKSLEINGHLVLDGKDLMTGHEWYELFVKEWLKVIQQNRDKPDDVLLSKVTITAKKASGI